MKDPHFWRTMYKTSNEEAEYWKSCSAVFLMCLVILVLYILYLKFGGA